MSHIRRTREGERIGSSQIVTFAAGVFWLHGLTLNFAPGVAQKSMKGI
jgi:hypothetical protein